LGGKFRAEWTVKLDFPRHKVRRKVLCFLSALFVCAIADGARGHDGGHGWSRSVPPLKAELRNPPRGLLENIVIDGRAVDIEMGKRPELAQESVETSYTAKSGAIDLFGAKDRLGDCRHPKGGVLLALRDIGGVYQLFEAGNAMRDNGQIFGWRIAAVFPKHISEPCGPFDAKYGQGLELDFLGGHERPLLDYERVPVLLQGLLQSCIGLPKNITASRSSDGQNYRESAYNGGPIRNSPIVIFCWLIFTALCFGLGCLRLALRRGGDWIAGLILLSGCLVAAGMTVLAMTMISP
jgi:hypothetical protein